MNIYRFNTNDIPRTAPTDLGLLRVMVRGLSVELPIGVFNAFAPDVLRALDELEALRAEQADAENTR